MSTPRHRRFKVARMCGSCIMLTILLDTGVNVKATRIDHEREVRYELQLSSHHFPSAADIAA
jgi:hypothetical protein